MSAGSGMDGQSRTRDFNVVVNNLCVAELLATKVSIESQIIRLEAVVNALKQSSVLSRGMKDWMKPIIHLKDAEEESMKETVVYLVVL